MTTETLTPAGDTANPSFTLGESPVLADPSSTGSGYVSSLRLVIDGRVWTWVPRLDKRTPPRAYITGTDGQGRTTITLGQPLPHPASTVTTTYRVGNGGLGNVRAGQLTQLLTRPLAVAAVTNPLAASDGSVQDGPDSVRANAPRGLQALGRVVSVDDAADIALTWAGIGKSKARLTNDAHGNILGVTVAGTSPNPLDPTGALLTNLGAALTAAGDVTVPIVVAPAQISLLVIAATIRHDDDITWGSVESAVRTELTGCLAYSRRDINEPIVISELIAAIHRVDGVQSAKIDKIGLVDSGVSPVDLAMFQPSAPPSSGRIDVSGGVAYLSDAIAETLVLEEFRQ
jgi:predicted phage baseplate assembly protein